MKDTLVATSTTVPIGKRRFDPEDQHWFAAVSGDRNPLHLDSIVARRLMYGRTVVHGVHVALWAMDRYLALQPSSVGSIDVRFIKPVFLDEEVEAVTASASAETALLRVERDGVTLLTVRLRFDASDVPLITGDRSITEIPSSSPRELSFEDLYGRAGSIEIPGGDAELETAFPAASAQLGTVVPAHLMGLSRLVGMVCPGLHSVFGGFSVAVHPSGRADQFDWAVSRADERFSACQISVSGGVLQGTITAFLRPKPVVQPSSTELSRLVEADEFSGVVALIIGGSRGLGELTAKLVGAGGGTAVVTWHRGRSDADAVMEEIRSAGGKAWSFEFDISDPDPPLTQLQQAELLPTHVFYFASPRIFIRRTGSFDASSLSAFIDAYVTGFVRAVEACHRHGVDDLVAFYPSSVAVHEGHQNLVEYAAAKAAGEITAQVLSDSEPWLEVMIERLPRLETDQTATLADAPDGANAEDILVRILREVSRLGRHKRGDGHDGHPLGG